MASTGGGFGGGVQGMATCVNTCIVLDVHNYSHTHTLPLIYCVCRAWPPKPKPAAFTNYRHEKRGLTFSAGRAPSCSQAPSRRACCRSGSVYRVVHVCIYCIILSILLYISLVQNTKNKYGSKFSKYLPYHRNSIDTYYKLISIAAYISLLQNTT